MLLQKAEKHSEKVPHKFPCFHIHIKSAAKLHKIRGFTVAPVDSEEWG